MSRTIRIYVAGKYSADNVIEVLENMRRGMRIGAEVLAEGFAPFVPWMDYHFTLMRPKDKLITIEDYYRYSMAWLEASDGVLVISGMLDSKGVKAEMDRAEELGIPIFSKLEEMKAYFEFGYEFKNKNAPITHWDRWRWRNKNAPITHSTSDWKAKQEREQFIDPYDAIRKEHWEIREEGKDDLHPDVWYCKKHDEEFIIIEDYCIGCKKEVDGEHYEELNSLVEDEDDFDFTFDDSFGTIKLDEKKEKDGERS